MLNRKLAKIEKLEEDIKKMQNQKSTLLAQYKEQERKERTHRLCKRGGLLESVFPDIIKLSDAQAKTFLEKTLLTDYARYRFKDALNEKTTATSAKNDALATSGKSEAMKPAQVLTTNSGSTGASESAANY